MIAIQRAWPTAVALILVAGSLGAQQCNRSHYRWDAKTTTSLESEPALPMTIAAILARWTVPALGPGAAYWCAPRVGRERRVYVVEGWLRFADTTKADGDWHLELTERRDDPVDRCIVVEIPARQWGSVFVGTHASLDSILRSGVSKWKRNQELVPPVHVRVTGAAFFDAEHIHGQKRPRAQGHGRCNSSLLSLWEIHPVYRIERL
jgi:hypothetical protein